MTYYTFHPHGPKKQFPCYKSHETKVSQNILNCQAMKNCFTNALPYFCRMTKVTV